MAKDNAQRLADTIDYLKLFKPELGAHLEHIVNANIDREEITELLGEEISLHGSSYSTNFFKGLSNEGQRQALRALLLCQRVYLTDLWIGRVGNLVDLSRSLQHWRWKPRHEIEQAISTYTIASNTHEALVLAAKQFDLGIEGKMNDRYLFLTRQQPFPTSATCYSQVFNWLLQSGITSLRWRKKFAPAGTDGDFSSLGPQQQVIAPYAPTPVHRILIAKGMIVFMFSPVKPRGHWMVSDGGGYAYGSNNSGFEPNTYFDGEHQVDPLYDRCLIHRQFIVWKQEHPASQLVTYDPLTIANRI